MQSQYGNDNDFDYVYKQCKYCISEMKQCTTNPKKKKIKEKKVSRWHIIIVIQTQNRDVLSASPTQLPLIIQYFVNSQGRWGDSSFMLDHHLPGKKLIHPSNNERNVEEIPYAMYTDARTSFHKTNHIALYRITTQKWYVFGRFNL